MPPPPFHPRPAEAPAVPKLDGPELELQCRSVRRVASIIKALAYSPPLSMTQISRAVQLPYATSYRFVRTLVAEGLIQQERPFKRYRLCYPPGARH